MKVLGAALAIVVVAACSGQTSSTGKGDSGTSSGSSGSSSSSSGGSSGSSSGSSGSSSGTGFGCPGDFTTTPSRVDPNVCSPQLASTTSCMNQPCSWTLEVPCQGDAGASDGGASDCMAWCTSAAPPGAGPAGFCQVFPIDGGPALMVSCGGCGV